MRLPFRSLPPHCRLGLAAPLWLALLVGCAREPAPLRVPGGDAERGRQLMAQYQCTACHAIPEVPGVAGKFGPPLDGFGRRSYIAGGIPNTPQGLVGWLDDPQRAKPGTAMPDLGVAPSEARDMAAYLFTLR